MKYFLSTAGKKCCKDCTWLLSLARKEEGYDLIQLKRGFSDNKHLMKLYPGEPAVILDTGEFYIGDAAGRPMLINPNGAFMPETGSSLCVRNDASWTQGSEVLIDHSDFITSDDEPPNDADCGRYICAVILDDSDVPVGIGFIEDWCADNTKASVLIGYFTPTEMVEFTESDIDLLIQQAEEEINLT